MIRWMVMCGTLAIALPFGISAVASKYGTAVSERFLERPTELPAEVDAKGPLTAAMLQRWATAKGTAEHARGYAQRVIPIDMLYLVFLGAFLGLAATCLAGLGSSPHWISAAPVWVWWIVPLVYVVCDLAEDSMIFALLTWPSHITDGSLDWLAVFRWIKIRAVGVSMAVVLLLGLISWI